MAMSLADANQSRPPAPRAGRRSRIAVDLSVAMVAILCYVGTLNNGFCHDDIPIVVTNPHVIGTGQWNAIWTTDYWGGAGSSWQRRDLLYRPVAVTSIRIVHTLFPRAAWPQHVVNTLLHAMIAVLLVRLVRTLTDDIRVVLIAGLLFAALPIHSEVIASVVGRSDLLATLGLLAAMLLHLRASCPGRSRWLGSIGAAAAVFVAMASKECGTVAPICVVVADYFFHRDGVTLRVATGARRAAASFRRTWYLVIPVAVYVSLRLYALDGAIAQGAPLTKTMNVLAGAGFGQRAIGVIQLWGMYWAKTIWPRVLNIDYSINAVRLATSIFDTHVLIGLAATGVLGIFAARRLRGGDSAPALFLALCVLCYMPTSNLFILMRAFFAERVWYLPSVWVAILLASALAPTLKLRAVRVAFALALAAMVGRCVLRTGDWKDNMTLYAAAYRDHPNGVQALRHYGRTLAETSEIQKGIALLRQAVEIDLGYTDAYRDLGRALLAVDKYDEALSVLQTAQMQVPGHPPTLLSLRRARDAVAAGRAEELARLRARAEEMPGDLAAHVALVQALRDSADLPGAIAHLQKHQSRFAGVARWAREHAVILVMLDDLDGAINQYRRAVEVAPRDIDAAVELAMLLLERNAASDVEDAWQLVTRIEAIAPSDVSVLICRAELLAHKGEAQSAIDAYRRAVALEPKSSPRRNAMVQRLRALGG